jgi:hypothetical protein
VATNYAREAMEDVKNMDFEKIAPTSKSVINANRKYRIDVNVSLESTNLKKVFTVVSWKDRNGIGKSVETSMLVNFMEVFASDAAKIVLFTESYNILNSASASEYEKYTSTELTAVIKDKKGNTITDWGEDPNEGPISFSIISAVIFGTLSDAVVTPINGRAYTTFTSNGSISGNFGINIIKASVYLPDAEKTVTDTTTIKITNGPVKIVLDADPKIIKASATNYSTITASLIDAAGKTLMKKGIFTDIEITFSVFGEGNLSTSTITIPFDSGDESDASAEIILNSTGNPGLASVVATATDLESGKIDVRFLGPPVAISISANPNPMYFDAVYSTITVSLLDINGSNTNPTDELITISLELTTNDTGGHLVAPYSWDFPTSDSKGIIRETTFTGQSSTGTATITASASGGGLTVASVTIKVILALVPDHIILSASPQNVKADGIELSTIKATVYDISGKVVTNYTGTINFVETLGTFYGANPAPVVNGVATIEIGSDIPGNATVNIVNPDPANLTIEPSEGIVIGFYSDPASIELTANPTKIYGAETSVITAVIYDGFGNIVVGESITFNTTFGTFSNELNTIKITPLDGIAITELSSDVIGDPITATINAFSSTLSAIPIDVILHEKVDLFLVIDEPISYEPVDKTVAFTIKVTGKDITVDEMKVSWSDSTPSEKLYKITVDNNEEIFNGNKKSGDNADINPNKDLSIGEYNIKLTFIQDMDGRHIWVTFYPPVSGQYPLECDVP